MFRLRAMAIASALVCLLGTNGVSRGDDGSITAVGGAVRAMNPHDSIHMLSEYVHAWISPDQVRVECVFVLQNKGPATTVMVGYPNQSGGADVDRPVPFGQFQSYVDGLPVEVRVMPDSTDHAYDYWSWWVKTVDFAAGEVKCLRNEYVAQPGTSWPNYRSWEYILETGATWAGPIGIGDIVVTVVGIDPDSLGQFSPSPTSRSASEFRWHFKNLEPTPDSRLSRIRVGWLN